MVMWAAALFILENYHDDIKDTDFSQRILQVAKATLSAPEEVLCC